jgi:hypothetical protein
MTPHHFTYPKVTPVAQHSAGAPTTPVTPASQAAAPGTPTRS